jgi:hypothetical protein
MLQRKTARPMAPWRFIAAKKPHNTDMQSQQLRYRQLASNAMHEP